MRKSLLSLSICLCLAACVSTSGHVDRNPDAAQFKGAPGYMVDSRWLAAHRGEIISQAEEFLHKEYPSIAADFPSIHVRRVNLYLDDKRSVDNGPAQDELASMLQTLSDGMLGDRPDSQVWQADVDIRSIKFDDSTLYAVMMLPQFAVCFSTVFVVCPSGGRIEVVATMHLTRPDGRTLNVTAGGVGTMFMTSMLREDVDSPGGAGDDRRVHAVVASLVGVSDALVAEYKKEHGN